ncbi:magnesium transporter CorA family protein [Actinospica sp. MGRD01-02]|uniref:Magnesium transporter CorA family protein n=1 Tax=Actinospica acidithermotolerans TaxID=2828514 RepID=A0A941EH21_9ACTN|nr:magnesium transporter CorA family protein [Actinospica acidithermotolerans]MBR7831156.1 magnesium transporter CorA family protein [Actinospica acidithermotolerans]
MAEEAAENTQASPNERPRRSRAYRGGRLVAENFPLADVSDWIEYDDAAVWYDLESPTAEELEELREELGLHSLAIEDATHLSERPKCDRYEGHLVLTAYQVKPSGDGELDKAMMLAFITHRAVITVHDPGTLDIPEILRRWDESPDLAKHGLPFLVYGLLDYIVDGYFDALQVLDDRIEDLSDLIFETAAGRESAVVLRETFDLRRGLLTARHVITPMREVVNAIMRWNNMPSELAPYYQDVYDHVLRTADWVDNLRDLLATVRETQLTIQGNRMNLIMKKVTSWAAIVAVPTAITGWYGQNVPYPGFSSESGLWTSTGLILGLSGLLYFTFKRNDWL